MLSRCVVRLRICVEVNKVTSLSLGFYSSKRISEKLNTFWGPFDCICILHYLHSVIGYKYHQQQNTQQQLPSSFKSSSISKKSIAAFDFQITHRKKRYTQYLIPQSYIRITCVVVIYASSTGFCGLFCPAPVRSSSWQNAKYIYHNITFIIYMRYVPLCSVSPNTWIDFSHHPRSSSSSSSLPSQSPIYTKNWHQNKHVTHIITISICRCPWNWQHTTSACHTHLLRICCVCFPSHKKFTGLSIKKIVYISFSQKSHKTYI